MSDDERDRLRKLQDRWLALPLVRRLIATYGEDSLIYGFYATDGPSFRDVGKVLYPSIEPYFRSFFEGQS